jgi:hypothetical protein
VNGNPLSSDIIIFPEHIGSEPAVIVGTTEQFWREDKARTDFGDSASAVVSTVLAMNGHTAITTMDIILCALERSRHN